MFDTPMAIAWSGAIGVPIGLFINASPNKKLINYSYYEQMNDFLPSFIISVIMGLSVWSLTLLGWTPILTILFQMIFGIAVYLLLSLVTRMEPFIIIWAMIKKKRTNNDI